VEAKVDSGVQLFSPSDRRPTLITGGAGFVGANVANRIAHGGGRVRILDNLARPGVERNVEWLTQRYPEQIEIEKGDVRNAKCVDLCAQGVQAVFHFAAQVAVTTSIRGPRQDFSTNLVGTFNVLESLRLARRRIPLLYTSTNKVYGDLNPGSSLRSSPSRYEAVNGSRAFGEETPLCFHSPYGCSKGAADQYVLDYYRSYRLPTVVFRMSCIYGPRQFGTEDQGWVAHFLARALNGETLHIYGDGRQVRDLLFVDDLVDAMLAACDRIDSIGGEVFNIGGGFDRSASLLEVLDLIERFFARTPNVKFSDWRLGDQRYYVSDISKARRLLDWSPRVSVQEGLQKLGQWLKEASIAGPRLTPAAAIGGGER
jgi:CDP-paratose 2-epimerase